MTKIPTKAKAHPGDFDAKQARQASSLLSLAATEEQAVDILIEKELYREAAIHLYFSTYYISSAILSKQVKFGASHNSVESLLNKNYGRQKGYQKYVQLHNRIHGLRTHINYQSTAVPNPNIIKKEHKLLIRYLKFATRILPRVLINNVLLDLLEKYPASVLDFSFDIYCPKTYRHHNRITFWQRPTYFEGDPPKKVMKAAKEFLKSLKVKKWNDYVLGVNSKLDQYSRWHLLMLDIDTFDPGAETELRKIGGYLFKSGRGYHFIATKPIDGEQNWRKKIRMIQRNKILNKFADKNHLIISLQRGYSTLRLTTNHLKPNIPTFYKELI